MTAVDHCTGWFEGWWAAACAAHDTAYGAQSGRAAADAQLFHDVAVSLPAWATAHPALAVAGAAASVTVAGVMWLGVRFFGGPFYRQGGRDKR
ncbi:hypothetical protein [Antarcticirhabdus aurantiaca]|uniref:hypothetical protein n=1 Tax=Antarcticirhabdus aurantiaca TaxID=2606717 RepID=UPI00131B7B1A|nr:hypothetical protein [Antarcticirhabdus aurantiaca]